MPFTKGGLSYRNVRPCIPPQNNTKLSASERVCPICRQPEFASSHEQSFSDSSASTDSIAVAALMQGNFVEEFECKDNATGPPAKRLRLATQMAQVLRLVLDASECR